MEEEKAAAYYDELTRKGEAAARFKQGLGFSNNDNRNDAVPVRGSALASSSSSFLSQFVRASSPNSTAKLEKESQIRSIQDKLRKEQKPPLPPPPPRVSERSDGRRCRSREKDDDREGRHRRRSRSRSRDRERDRERRRRRRSSRSLSPRRERRRRSDDDDDEERRERRRRREEKNEKRGGGNVDYSRLIQGYDRMSAAERVKAKMKFQLAETAEKDKAKGAGWERFEFDKDAPVDEEELEAADDDAALVKRIGQSFRFSAIEARREEQSKAAHDEAMFGAPTHPLSTSTEDLETDTIKRTGDESNPATSLLSEKVLAKQQGSWRDRARRV